MVCCSSGWNENVDWDDGRVTFVVSVTNGGCCVVDCEGRKVDDDGKNDDGGANVEEEGRNVDGVVWYVVGSDVCTDEGGIVWNVGGSGVEDSNAAVDIFVNSEDPVVEIFLGGANVDNNKISSGTELDSFGKTTIGFVVENGGPVENISDIGLGWKPSLITFAEYQDSGNESDISARHSCNTGKKIKSDLVTNISRKDEFLFLL